MNALPDDLIQRILALLPDDTEAEPDLGEGFGGVKVSSRYCEGSSVGGQAAHDQERVCSSCRVAPPLPAPCCRGAAERVCRRWRRLALALSASRVKFDFTKGGVQGESDAGFLPAVLRALSGRAVGRVEIINAAATLPLGLWEALGGLVARAQGCGG